MSVPTTLKTALAGLAWGSEVQGLDMNQIREAAMRIHPFHLGSTAIIIIIATNGAWKQYSCDWKGQALLYTRKTLQLLHSLAQSSSYMRAYKPHAGAMFRGVLNGSWRRRVVSVEGWSRHGFAVYLHRGRYHTRVWREGSVGVFRLNPRDGLPTADDECKCLALPS